MAQVGNRVLICMDLNGLENALLHTAFNPNYGIVEAVKQEPNMKEPTLTVRGDDGLIYEGAKSCFYTQKEFSKAIDQFKNNQQQIIQTAQSRIAKLNRSEFSISPNLAYTPFKVDPKGPAYLFVENKSMNRAGNYFDGQDPYRENDFKFYAIGQDGRVTAENGVYMCTKGHSAGTPKVVVDKLKEVYETFRKEHPGQNVVVLRIPHNDDPLVDKIKDAMEHYKTTNKALEVFAPYGYVAKGLHGTCKWSIDGKGTLTISPTDGQFGLLNEKVCPWKDSVSDIKKVVVEQGVRANLSSAYLFSGLRNCERMDLRGLDMSMTQNAEGMFYGCKNLKYIDVDNLNLKDSLKQKNMFTGCDKLDLHDMFKIVGKREETKNWTEPKKWEPPKPKESINTKNHDEPTR